MGRLGVTDPHDPQIITLVYDGGEGRCRVDIGTLNPVIAARWLFDAAEQVEGFAVDPTYVVIIDGVEQVLTPEPEED